MKDEKISLGVMCPWCGGDEWILRWGTQHGISRYHCRASVECEGVSLDAYGDNPNWYFSIHMNKRTIENKDAA